MKSVHAALKADQEVSEVLQFRTETVEICFCHGIINGTREECEEAERKVFEKTGVHVFSRLRCVFVCLCVCVFVCLCVCVFVCVYLCCTSAAFNPMFQNRFARCRGEWEGGRKMYFEWNMGNVNGRIGDEVYLENWQLFAREMKALKEKK